jgi:hypothetical protein
MIFFFRLLSNSNALGQISLSILVKAPELFALEITKLLEVHEGRGDSTPGPS